MTKLTVERLRDLLSYDQATGVFVWRRKPHDNATSIQPGGVAGSYCGRGYLEIKIDGRAYKAHRLAWLYTHNEWPPILLDHRNRDKKDNRIDNLRPASHAENSRNSVLRTAAKYPKGVRAGARKGGNVFYAQIGWHGRRIISKAFDSPEQAGLAYLSMRAELHGEFAPGA